MLLIILLFWIAAFSFLLSIPANFFGIFSVGFDNDFFSVDLSHLWTGILIHAVLSICASIFCILMARNIAGHDNFVVKKACSGYFGVSIAILMLINWIVTIRVQVHNLRKLSTTLEYPYGPMKHDLAMADSVAISTLVTSLVLLGLSLILIFRSIILTASRNGQDKRAKSLR